MRDGVGDGGAPPRTGGTAPSVPKPVHALPLSSGVIFAVSLVVQALGLVGTYFVYKHIGILQPNGPSLVATAQLFLLIGSSINGIGDLRLGTAYTYFLARGVPAPQSTSTYLVLRTVMVAAAGAILFGVLSFSVGVGNITSLAIFLSLPVLWSVSTVYNYLYIGLGNSLKAQYPTLIESIVRLPVLIFVAYRLQSVEGITIAYAVGAAASAVYCLPAVLRQFGRVRAAVARQLFRFAWPLMGSLLLTYLVTNMVPLIIAAGLPRAELTYFLAANGWRVLVLSLPLAVTTPLFPYLAGLHRTGSHEAIRRGTWQALRYTSMLLVPGVVALVTYRYPFLNDLSTHLYAVNAATPLAILVAGAIPLALSQVLQTSINAIGRQRLELYITSTQVVVLFSAIFLLMPPWGPFQLFPPLDAAAVAILLSSCAALALNTYFAETLIRIHVHPATAARVTLGAVGAFGLFVLINRSQLPILDNAPVFPTSGGVQLVLAVLLGFLVYFLLLAAMGELTKVDVERIGHAFGLPPRLLRIVQRLCWRGAPVDLAPVALERAPGLAPTELPETFTGTTELPSMGELESGGEALPSAEEPRR